MKDHEVEILIIDDDDFALETTVAHLARQDYRLTLASSAHAALDILKTHDPDVVLLDVMMPKMNGFELCTILKQNPRWEAIPVVLVTALDSRQDVLRGLEAGADEFLTKPVNGPELRARIRNLVKVKAYHDLLNNVLPATIGRRLRQGEETIADSFAEVTVLFADIVGFTTYASSVSPQVLVGHLNEIFIAFDALAAELGLEKIKTIGDAYMVAAGLPEPMEDGVGAAAHMALGMRKQLALLNEKFDNNFSMRIGLHTGPVVAGVIGSRKYSYDLWGDTVNIASRMESQSETGKIQISESTQELLEGRFQLVQRGEIEIKGKGKKKTWFLEG